MAKASTKGETTLPIEDLAEDPLNPRFISDEALGGLEVSMVEYDDIAGIVWNERTGELVAGHQRLTGLRRAGATTWRRISKTLGVIVHPKTGAEWFIRIVDWDSQKQRIANITANNPHIAGEFTPAALEQLRALEDEAAFTALRLDELQSAIAKTADKPPSDSPEYDESIADGVEMLECPACGHKWPK
jgi:hypothetical protein